MTLYVIATPRFTESGHYRTRYFIECRDGRARFGDKAGAYRMTAAQAGTVAAQLRALAAWQALLILDDSARPHRRAWDAAQRPRSPKQTEIPE